MCVLQALLMIILMGATAHFFRGAFRDHVRRRFGGTHPRPARTSAKSADAHALLVPRVGRKQTTWPETLLQEEEGVALSPWWRVRGRAGARPPLP